MYATIKGQAIKTDSTPKLQLSSVSSSSSTSARSATLLTLCQDLFRCIKVTLRKTKAPVVQHRDPVTLISYIHGSFVLLNQSFVSITQINHWFDHVELTWTNDWSWNKLSLDKRARKNKDFKLVFINVKRRLYLLPDFFLLRYWFFQLDIVF